MPYTPTTWLDRLVEHPNRFTLVDNGDGTVTLVPAPGTVTQAGTSISAGNMNNIETGLAEAFADAGAAQETANAALPKSGGKLTGYIDHDVTGVIQRFFKSGVQKFYVNYDGDDIVFRRTSDTKIMLRYRASDGKVLIEENEPLPKSGGDMAGTYPHLKGVSQDLFLSAKRNAFLCSNAYLDSSAAWQRYDTTKPSAIIFPSGYDGKPYFSYSAAGTGPIVWTDYNLFHSGGGTLTGDLTIDKPGTAGAIEFWDYAANQKFIRMKDSVNSAGAGLQINNGVVGLFDNENRGALYNSNTIWHSGNSTGGATIIPLQVWSHLVLNGSGATTQANGYNAATGGGLYTFDLRDHKFAWQSALATGKSVYFEAVIHASSGSTTVCGLRRLSNNTFLGEVSTTATTATRVRSSNISASLIDGVEYCVNLYNTTGAQTAYLYEARLIII